MKNGIAICGRMGAGKDTLAALIAEQLQAAGVPAVVLSQGDAVRELLAQRLGISVQEIAADKERYRTQLQELGEAHRALVIAKGREMLARVRDRAWPIMISRTHADVAAMREEGLVTVRVEAPIGVRFARVLSRDGALPPPEAWTHPTECDPDCDGVLSTIAPIEILKKQIIYSDGTLSLPTHPPLAITIPVTLRPPAPAIGGLP
jgi:cytidylate kinase